MEQCHGWHLPVLDFVPVQDGGPLQHGSQAHAHALQGIPPNRFNYKTAGVKGDDLKFAVANAMSANVLMRLLPDTLWAAGLLVEKKIVLPTRFSKYVCY